jgi:hypothetical protein
VRPGHDNVCHNYKILGVIKCITCLAVKLLGGARALLPMEVYAYDWPYFICCTLS